MNNNVLNEEEQVVFEEINNWLRSINNTLWVVTSLFITGNFVLMMSDKYRSIIDLLKGCFLGKLIFLLLLLVMYMFVMGMIISSIKLGKLMVKGRLTKENLAKYLEFNYGDFLKIYHLKAAIGTLWGNLFIVFILFFIYTWFFN